MANPRQRRKARSGTYRKVSHSRNAKTNLKKTPLIRGPKALQDAWDKRKTVRQNYASMGLAVSLDPALHGGVEKVGSRTVEEEKIESADAPMEDSTDGSLVAGPSGLAEVARIIRDKDGNVTGFETLAPTTISETRDEEEEEGMVEPDIDEPIRQKWVVDLGARNPSQIGAKGGDVIKELERIAAPSTGTNTLCKKLSGVGSRHGSEGERRYLSRLVDKYGSDVDGMARDRRLNVEQRTVGQLRRSLKKHGMPV